MPGITRAIVLSAVVSLILSGIPSAAAGEQRQQVLQTMNRATAFMTDEVSHRGGYLWNYLPDFSRRWGEMEAYDTMIWLKTFSLGHSTVGRISRFSNSPRTSLLPAHRHHRSTR